MPVSRQAETPEGVGQALWEQCSYERESGQLLSGSFMDYAMPRASMLPFFTTELSETPAPSNPLGVRAGGEGGTTPSLAVVVNAIVDALSDYGVTHFEMPVTSERSGGRSDSRPEIARRLRFDMFLIRWLAYLSFVRCITDRSAGQQPTNRRGLIVAPQW
jgi:Molybdopterin-binding domain of aldehyde dehydrogenase